MATPSGNGYCMVASDGGVFAFGRRPVRRLHGVGASSARRCGRSSPTPTSRLLAVASDGGIFAFDGVFRESMGGRPLNRPVSGMVRYGNGYLLVGEDGGIFSFSDLPFLARWVGARPGSRWSRSPRCEPESGGTTCYRTRGRERR